MSRRKNPDGWYNSVSEPPQRFLEREARRATAAKVAAGLLERGAQEGLDLTDRRQVSTVIKAVEQAMGVKLGGNGRAAAAEVVAIAHSEEG